MERPWRIELLGACRATLGGGGPERTVAQFSTRKVAALLAYLAYFAEREHPREILIDLLWPESDESAGRKSPNVALSSLRQQLEPPGVPPGAVLVTDRFTAHLNPSGAATDVREFLDAAEAASGAGTNREQAALLARAVDLYRGPLLPG